MQWKATRGWTRKDFAVVVVRESRIWLGFFETLRIFERLRERDKRKGARARINFLTDTIASQKSHCAMLPLLSTKKIWLENNGVRWHRCTRLSDPERLYEPFTTFNHFPDSRFYLRPRMKLRTAIIPFPYFVPRLLSSIRRDTRFNPINS